MRRKALERAESARKWPRAGGAWRPGWAENHTFGGAGSTVGDSGPPRGKTLPQAPPVGPTDGANGLGTGGIGQEGAKSWWILAAGCDEKSHFRRCGLNRQRQWTFQG